MQRMSAPMILWRPSYPIVTFSWETRSHEKLHKHLLVFICRDDTAPSIICAASKLRVQTSVRDFLILDARVFWSHQEKIEDHGL